ncbi:hypothetical protein B0O99DRAFT_680204 [Bisporella sp. PMI_857]|nr:hypothetical protein B0O99DRAFT_680204 [Bisporella sp. PMI_857]
MKDATKASTTGVDLSQLYSSAPRVLVGSTILLALLATYLSGTIPHALPKLAKWRPEQPDHSPFICAPHDYSTEIVSTDPLLIYINNFTTPLEIRHLIEAGSPNLAPSEIYIHNRKVPSRDRTSKSAGLSPSLPVAQCILDRARAFMGTLLRPIDDFSTPQLVQYQASEYFNLHHDWYPSPQLMADGSGRRFNRVASFFMFLEGDCEEGETWFPYLSDEEEEEREGRWRKHEDGGLSFKPREGNALFWVNLHQNGTGDRRVMHAGLPLKSGVKTGINLWPRRFY